MTRAPSRTLDRATLVGMAAGLGVMLAPGFERAMEVGFFVTLAATVAQIVVGHLPRAEAGAAAAVDTPLTVLPPKSEE